MAREDPCVRSRRIAVIGWSGTGARRVGEHVEDEACGLAAQRQQQRRLRLSEARTAKEISVMSQL